MLRRSRVYEARLRTISPRNIIRDYGSREANQDILYRLDDMGAEAGNAPAESWL